MKKLFVDRLNLTQKNISLITIGLVDDYFCDWKHEKIIQSQILIKDEADQQIKITKIIKNTNLVTDQSRPSRIYINQGQDQMNEELRKLGLTTKVVSAKSFSDNHNQDKSQLFMPQQIEMIKLNSLRSKRKQLEDKLKLISNRISYRRKKQQQQLRRYIRTEQRSRIISQTKNYKKFKMMVKEENHQKEVFQERKKAKEVEQLRMTTNRRLHLIYQSVRDRKMSESEKVRQIKKSEQELKQAMKQQALNEIKQKHENVQKMKEQQLSKRKCYWLQKRLSFQQNILQEVSLYENKIQDYYKKIEQMKKNQEILKQKEQHAIEVLKCAEQNYELLKQS